MIELNEMKALTAAQYDVCRAAAIKRVEKRVGDKPQRKQFEREMGAIWTVLDVLALVVFLAALVVSSVHIITHMGELAATSHAALATGIQINQHDYTVAHQLGMIALAEASMLLFMTMHAMHATQRASRPPWNRWLSVPLLLALTAALFVFVANWQSDIGLLEALMPPAFTIGLGLHFEKLLVAAITRRQEVDARYIHALETWEAASGDPTRHPDFVPIFAQELWSRLVSLKANAAYVDAPASIRVAAVQRELERETWAREVVAAQQPVAIDVNPTAGDTQPVPAVSINGAGRSRV